MQSSNTGLAMDVKKLYEQILKHADSLMNMIGGGVAVLDRDMRIVSYAQTYEKWFGPLEENKGKLCYEVFCRGERPCPACPVEEVFTHPDLPAASKEGEMVTTEGVHLPVRVIFLPIKDPDGNVRYVMEVAEDMTEKQRAERELAERSRLLVVLNEIVGILLTGSSFEEAAPQVIEALDVKAACLYVFDEAAGRYNMAAWKGLPPEIQHALETVPADDALARMAARQHVCRAISEKDFPNEESVMHPWPRFGAKHVMLMPFRAAGHCVGFLLLFREEEKGECIEEFCKALRLYLSSAIEKDMLLRKLKASETKYRGLFEASPDDILVVDKDLTILEANPSCAKSSGYTADEIIGESALKFLPPDYHEMVAPLVERVLAGERLSVEIETVRKDGARRQEEMSIALLEEMGREAAIVISRDISDRKKAERETRLMAKLTQTVTDAIIAVDKQANITAWNPGAERIFGYTAEEAVGRCISLIHFSEEAMDEVHKALLEKGEVVSERVRRNKAGEPLDVIESISCLRDDAGNIESYVGFVKDITQLKQTQQQLFQVQKMESIGTLAGGIAHDFNNLLSGMLGHASFLKESIPRESDLYADVERIENSAKRAAALTKQLLSFARGGKYEPQRADLNEIVRETLDLLTRTIGKNIALQKSLQHDLWQVQADRTQMQQVLVNLCINARDAMPEGGTLLLETKNVELKEEDLKPAYAPAKPGKYIQISVSDTGIGMDAETRRRAFEPFFSMKEGGTGLGLSVVYGVLQSHKGFITVYSELGKGTTFRIYVPAAERAIEKPAVEAEEEVATGRETILVIDDEPVVQQVLSRMLEKMGYTVLVAPTGSEGLIIYSDNKSEIDLILLDMIIPDMPGQEVFRRLKEINPDVKVLLSSGFSETAPAVEAQRHGALGFLEKPYTMGELSARLRSALEKQPQRAIKEKAKA